MERSVLYSLAMKPSKKHTYCFPGIHRHQIKGDDRCRPAFWKGRMGKVIDQSTKSFYLKLTRYLHDPLSRREGKEE